MRCFRHLAAHSFVVLFGVCMAFLRPAEGDDWALMSLGVAATPEAAAAMVAALVLRGVAA